MRGPGIIRGRGAEMMWEETMVDRAGWGTGYAWSPKVRQGKASRSTVYGAISFPARAWLGRWEKRRLVHPDPRPHSRGYRINWLASLEQRLFPRASTAAIAVGLNRGSCPEP